LLVFAGLWQTPVHRVDPMFHKIFIRF
jgi:hypothetical protein